MSAFAFDAAAPDPYAIPGSLGGGEVDVGAQNEDCPGMYTAFPSFGFTAAASRRITCASFSSRMSRGRTPR